MFTNKLINDSLAEAVKKVMKDEESGLRMAAHAAHKSGKKMFTFQGKTYPVKVQGEEVSFGEAIEEDKDCVTEPKAKEIAKKEVKSHETQHHGSKGDVAKHVKKMHKEETFKDRLIESAYGKKSPMIDEDDSKMTPEQKKKKEKIVLSMKDKEKEFKAKYGKNWKNVMYATATKLAMKEEFDPEDLEEAKDEKSEDAKEHYKKHVLPLYREHGLSPTFANAVNAHVKKYGIHQVWNHHSIDGTSMPSWFDTKVNRVKPLKQTYTHEHVEQVQEGEPSYYKGKSHTGNALPPPGSFADMKRTGNTLLKGFKSNPQPIKPYVAPKKQVDEVSQSEVDKFHKKLDTLVHSTFGKSSKEKKMKEDVEQMDEANLLHVKVGEKVRLTNPKSPASHTVDKIDGQDVHITKNDGKKVVMPLERIKRIKYQASKLGEDIDENVLKKAAHVVGKVGKAAYNAFDKANDAGERAVGKHVIPFLDKHLGNDSPFDKFNQAGERMVGKGLNKLSDLHKKLSKEDVEQIDEVGDTEKGRQALTRLIGARVQDPKGKHGLEGVKRALKRLGPARKLRGEEVEELEQMEEGLKSWVLGKAAKYTDMPPGAVADNFMVGLKKKTPMSVISHPKYRHFAKELRDHILNAKDGEEAMHRATDKDFRNKLMKKHMPSLGEEVEHIDEKNKSHTHAAHYENEKGEWVGMNLLVAKDDDDAIRQAHEKCKEGCRLSRVERHIPVKEEVDPPFVPDKKKSPANVTDKSGAHHTAMSRVRHLARQALEKQKKMKKEMIGKAGMTSEETNEE
jgi:hypothetical protein